MAWGTESVRKVDLISGPGNIYVTLAKKEVYGVVDIDMLAGPSEILIVADGEADPAYVAADMMSQAEHDVLAYMTFPREHWTQIASTNPIERLNGEVKRRSGVVGIFSKQKAVVRLVGALMLEQNDKWAVSRRYMTLEGLKPVTDDPLIKLPAAAA